MCQAQCLDHASKLIRGSLCSNYNGCCFKCLKMRFTCKRQLFIPKLKILMTCTGLERKESCWHQQASKDIEKAFSICHNFESRLCVLVFALLFVFLHEFVIVFWTGWLNGILLTGGNPVWHPRQAPRYLPPSQSVAPTIRTCVCISNLFCICICISNHQPRSTRMPPAVTISRTIRRATFTRPSSSRWDLQY